MKNNIFTEEERIHLLVRLLLMVKAKDLLIFTIDSFYIDLMIGDNLIEENLTDYGIKLKDRGNEFIKEHTNPVLPGLN